MQRGGGEAATAPPQTTTGAADLIRTNTGAADRLSVAAPGRCSVQRARQDAQRCTACVNAGLHGPGVATRTGAGMLLLHLPARGLGGVSGKPAPHNTSGGGAATTAQGLGVGGAKLPPHEQTHRAATTPQPNKHAQHHAAKGEGATLHQPRFAARPLRGTGGELVAVFTRRAQDITASYANPQGGRLLARRSRFA